MTITAMVRIHNKNWYIFFIQGGKEEYLRNTINKKGDVVAFVPMMERKYKLQGQYTIVIKPMFPGYLFIKTEKNQAYIEQLFHEYRKKASGLKKLLKYDIEGTKALHEEEIFFLDTILDENYVLKLSMGIIKNNTLVVKKGPLKGLERNIKKINRHTCLAKLHVEILNKEIQAGLEITSKMNDQRSNSRSVALRK